MRRVAASVAGRANTRRRTSDGSSTFQQGATAFGAGTNGAAKCIGGTARDGSNGGDARVHVGDARRHDDAVRAARVLTAGDTAPSAWRVAAPR